MAALLRNKPLVKAFVIILVIGSMVASGALSGRVQGARLDNRSVTLGSSQAGANTSYTLSFSIATPGTLGSIQAQFCANDPLLQDPCTIPTGFDISHAVISAESGETGFTVSNASTANNLILTRPPSNSLAQPSSYTLSNVINPSAVGSYYVRVQTFATADASGSDTDYGGLAFAITNSLLISAQVPPYILFCSAVSIPAYNCGSAKGDNVNLGNLSTTGTGAGQSQLLVATNAQSGYSIYMQGNTLTSGNNIINSLSVPTKALAGNNQFGLNLRANLSPVIGQDPQGPGNGSVTSDYDQINKFKYASGDVIASSPLAEDFHRFTVSYVADINKVDPPGVYVSTITYVATGNF